MEEDYRQQIIKEFQKKFIRGHGPISNGDNYPQDADSWVEADQEEIENWIWEKVRLSLPSRTDRAIKSRY